MKMIKWQQDGCFIKDDTVFDADKAVRAILVTLFLKDGDEAATEASLDELEKLLLTAGGQVFAVMTQAKDSPDARTCIGSGKVEELREVCERNEIPLVVFDTELSPSQIRNLEKELGDEVRVIDRSMLILDIFALHASSGEGKLQVELAQLKYTIPRLGGKGTQLSRLGGGIGTRGPGETKLETDRRHLKRRIAALEEQARVLEANRRTMRKQREKSGIFKFAIAGYTNAGKSTLLNYLTSAGILAENKLFATLDPTTRKFSLPSGTELLLTDTVGFIRNLPTHLIKAFKSTLDEVVFCDGILLVTDASDPEYENQLDVTEELMAQLGATDKPVVYVYNKYDSRCDEFRPRGAEGAYTVCISAKTGEGCGELIELMERIVRDGKTTEVFNIPSACASAVSYLYENASVLSCEYTQTGAVVTAVVDKKTKGAVEKMTAGGAYGK